MRALFIPFSNLFRISFLSSFIAVLAFSTVRRATSQLVYAENLDGRETSCNNFTSPFQYDGEIADDTIELEKRQVSSSVVIYDPNNPPTLNYHCGVLVEICENIVAQFAERSIDAINGRLTTMLNYSPARSGQRRNDACGKFNEKCKQFYSCDTRYSDRKYWRVSCDEFPFASSGEGGLGAHLRCVSPYEQNQQGQAQMLLGKYMAEVVTLASGAVTTKNWAALASGNPSFSRSYTFVLNQLESVGVGVADLSATVIGQNTYATFTKNAVVATPVAGTYNYDNFKFTASSVVTTCLCTSGAITSCSTCVPTRRPPFGTNVPDGGSGFNNNRKAFSPQFTPNPTPAPETSSSISKKNEQLAALFKRIGSLKLYDSLLKQNESMSRSENADSVAKLMGIFKRQVDSCPKEEENPEQEAEGKAESSQNESYDAERQADALPDSNSQKSNAEDAARKAEVAADQAINFLNSFVGPSVVSSAAAAALAAAALLNRYDPSIDSIYSKVTSAANQASSVLSIASANPTAFPSTCSTSTCATTGGSDGDGPTYIPPPPPPISTRPSTSSSTTTSSTSSPTGTPGQNGCFINGEIRTWGIRVREARPTSSCYEDLDLTVEPIDNSQRVRLSTILNGNKGYLSWTPQDIQNCGQVNFMQLIPTSDSTALTMEWQVDECNADKGARISPYWNGDPFPNFAIELLNLLPVGSPNSAALQCYKDSLKLTTYTDQYYTMLAPRAKDPVAICSDKYPQKTQTAAAQAQAHTNSITGGSPSSKTTNDPLLQQASAWPTSLLGPTPTNK